jgi:hypothetical protein
MLFETSEESMQLLECLHHQNHVRISKGFNNLVPNKPKQKDKPQ